MGVCVAIKKWVIRNHLCAVSYYAAFLLMYCILAWIAPYNAFYIQSQILSSFFGLWGLVLLAGEVLFVRGFKEVPHFIWLALFSLAVCLAIIVNYRYSLFSNLKCLAWTLIQIFALVPFACRATKSDLVFFLRTSFSVIAAIWTFACIVSVMQFFLGINYTFIDGQMKFQRQGIIDGRLFGIFIDPNYAACFSLIMIIASFFFLRKDRKAGAVKRALQVVIFVNWIYFAIAESRTAYVALAVVLVVVLLRAGVVTRRKGISAKESPIKKAAMFISVVLVSLAVITVAANLYSASVLGDGDSPTEHDSSSRPSISLTMREDVSSENITNNRTAIWSDYLEASKNHVLVGMSPRGYKDIIEEQYPDLYICNRNATGVYNVHNGFLEVYVATGIVGFVPLLIFGAILLFTCWRVLVSKQPTADSFMLAFLVLLVVCVKGMTHTTPFFSYGVDATLFWVSVGFLSRYMRSQRLVNRN